MTPLKKHLFLILLITFVGAGCALGGDEATKGKKGKKRLSGAFCMEKGIKCKGHMKAGKSSCKKCEGGTKAEFHSGTKADEIVQHVGEGLYEGISQMLVPEMDDGWISLDDDALETMMAFDDELLHADIEEGFNKTVEFGGFVEAMWGCKVTFKKKDGKFEKISECGMKAKKGMGKKPKEDDDTEEFLLDA